jgi:hippurate hydrolase
MDAVSSRLPAFLDKARAAAGHLRDIRRALHRNPELSFQEYETSLFIQSRLREMGVPFRIVATTGVVACLGEGERCVALRADIDALPIQEESGVEYASEKSGVMHACGHDAHTAMLLGAIELLRDEIRREGALSLGGVVKCIFQPGEEMSPGGASQMIQEGVLENPRPERIFGQHVNPDAECGTAAFVAGAMMASTDELYWTVRGKSGHAAQPHKSVDPILIAAHLITQAQTIVSRRLNPFEPGALSICSVHGGSATNVIPDAVELSGTLRSMNAAWREQTLKDLQSHARSIGEAGIFGDGAECLLRIERGYPALVNDEAATAFARRQAENLLGAERVEDFEPKMWGEDFAYYLREIPGSFWMLGIRPPERESIPGLHNSRFILDENALPVGAALLANVALAWLREDGEKPL